LESAAALPALECPSYSEFLIDTSYTSNEQSLLLFPFLLLLLHHSNQHIYFTSLMVSMGDPVFTEVSRKFFHIAFLGSNYLHFDKFVKLCLVENK